MNKLYVPCKTPSGDVYEILRRELQMLHISSIKVSGSVAIVESDDEERRSRLINMKRILNLPVHSVYHHSALLPTWLPFRFNSQALTVVHVDAHNDLLSPNLILSEDHLLDRWTGILVDPALPKTVCSAVDSTAIEIGSFLTMMLYWLPINRLIWIYPEGVQNTIQGSNNFFGIRLDWSYVDPLDNSLRRLQVIPVSAEDYDIAVKITNTSSNLFGAPGNVKGEKVILDIDLDYFDNTAESAHPLDEHKDAEQITNSWIRCQANKINQLLDNLPIENIVAVGIARSPGFCPAEKAKILNNLIIDSLSSRKLDLLK